MDDIEILKGMRELLAEPEHWTQEEDARDIAGNAVEALAQDAACWCLSGAACKTAGRPTSLPLAVILVISAKDPVGWNDTEGRTHAEVLAKLDEAIALEEAKS